MYRSLSRDLFSSETCQDSLNCASPTSKNDEEPSSICKGSHSTRERSSLLRAFYPQARLRQQDETSRLQKSHMVEAAEALIRELEKALKDGRKNISVGSDSTLFKEVCLVHLRSNESYQTTRSMVEAHFSQQDRPIVLDVEVNQNSGLIERYLIQLQSSECTLA